MKKLNFSIDNDNATETVRLALPLSVQESATRTQVLTASELRQLAEGQAPEATGRSKVKVYGEGAEAKKVWPLTASMEELRQVKTTLAEQHKNFEVSLGYIGNYESWGDDTSWRVSMRPVGAIGPWKAADSFLIEHNRAAQVEDPHTPMAFEFSRASLLAWAAKRVAYWEQEFAKQEKSLPQERREGRVSTLPEALKPDGILPVIVIKQAGKLTLNPEQHELVRRYGLLVERATEHRRHSGDRDAQSLQIMAILQACFRHSTDEEITVYHAASIRVS